MPALILIALAALAAAYWPSGGGMTPASQMSRAQFAQAFATAAAQVDMKGIPVNLALAQAALETGWGTGNVFHHTLGLFNLKAGSGWTTPGGWDGKSTYPATDGGVFRVYGSWASAIRDWVRLMSQTQTYHAAYLHAVAGDYKGFSAALQAAGYGGADPEYAAKIVSTYEAVA